MTAERQARAVVDRQLRAYNARDLEAYCACFTQDAVIAELSGREIARGGKAIRRTYTERFSRSPNLHCEVRGSMQLGRFVLDHEAVTGLIDGVLEVIALYEVRDSLIHAVTFIRKDV